MRELELFKPQVVSCPPRIREVGERYAEILGGMPQTICFISPVYHHAIDFDRGSIEVVEDRGVRIEGEIVVEPHNVNRVIRGIRRIRTRDPYGELRESPCTVTGVHKHMHRFFPEGWEWELFHVHFVCSPTSYTHRTENIERMLRGIKKIADRYGIKLESLI